MTGTEVEEEELYSTGCKYCGDDRRSIRADTCIDCTDPNIWFDDSWSLKGAGW